MRWERRKINEKRQRKDPADPCRNTASVFHSGTSSVFHRICRGKIHFQALAAHERITWNSFLDVTGILLLVTCLFGRHFCGYACAFGSLGDALYELTVWIRQKVFHQKGRHGYPEKTVRILQKVKYIWLAVLLLFILMGWYKELQA